jgi:hypothetical protein
LAVLPVNARPPAGAGREPLVERVRVALENGVRFLRNDQRNGGEWENSAIGNMRGPGGGTCLALLALLNSGVKPDDPVIRAGLAATRKRDPADTYVVGLQTMVLVEAGDPQDLPRIERNVQWLLDARVIRGGELKGWGYTRRDISADNSNSQYALLGLWAGQQAGVKISEADWESIYKFYTTTQQGSGGWFYKSDGDSTATLTMTVAGLCGVCISGQELDALRRHLNPDGVDPKCGIYDDNEPINKALGWLAQEDGFGGNRLRFNYPGRSFYNIYGIERAGRLTGRRLLAGHDWYREGCEYLVGLQHEDGSWFQSGTVLDASPTISTSFALLFLSKGRTPILISKFAHEPGEDWNNKHNDARHLAEFASKELFKRQPLAWQAYDARRLPSLTRDQLRGEIGGLLQSPILFMNGHQAPRLTPIQKQILKGYLDEGGFLIAEACCGREGFKDSFKALMKEFFPDTELVPLRADHPIWTSHFAIAKEFRESVGLMGIEQGCKTIVVFSPVPLAGYWEINKFASRSAKLDVPADDRGTQAFRLAGNIIAYATGLEMPKPRGTKVDVPDDRDDRHAPRGFLKVAQLQHEGDWQPAPRAMSNLMRYLRSEYKLDVTLEKEDLPVNSPDLFFYKFLYMHGRKSFDIPADQLESLRANLKAGGVLLADACCGKQEFDRAFRAFAGRLFPDAKLEPISPDDTLFSEEINGQGNAITTVRLRRERPDGQGAEAEFRDTRPTHFEGIKVNGRWVVVYSKYDLGCALEKHASSDCRGYDQDSALRLAASAVLYALKK